MAALPSDIAPAAPIIQKVGLQGLSCLLALVTERSVTRAAESMHMSQPAMSNTLGRLREALQDPLLVRTTRGMEPTPCALELADSVRLHLRGLESALAQQSYFVPEQAEGHVRVATSDSNVQLLRPVIATLRARAPGLRVTVRHPDFAHIRASLEDGECDLAIGYFPSVSPGLRQVLLDRQPPHCIVSARHPRIQGELTIDAYVRELHLGVSSFHHRLPTGDEALNAALSALGRSRTIGAWFASPLVYGEIVADTDMIATVGERLANSFAQSLPLQIFPLPFEIPSLDISLVWHERTHRIGLHKWVRQLLREGVTGSTGSAAR
jgi:LysR family transcriptional activator of mexEF-oprN operon